MKALSIMPYYASCIASGEKIEEYRSWKTDYRGDLLICASSRNEGPDLVRGHAICVVELYDITQRAPRDFVWHIRDVRFVEPFPVKGKLHLYDVEDEKIVFKTKGRTKCSISYDEAIDYWHKLGLCRELTPEEFDKYYE
jgi:hypothetical protein